MLMKLNVGEKTNVLFCFEDTNVEFVVVEATTWRPNDARREKHVASSLVFTIPCRK